jgi:hypothetical protein
MVATVKQNAPGELVPPNQVVWRSAFDGLEADVVVLWKHHLFSHSVVLKEQPALPAGMDPNSTVLEVLTEFVEAAMPTLNRQVWSVVGQPDVVDDVTIGFGQLLFIRGHAFATGAGQPVNVGVENLADPDAVAVRKQWQKLEDGRVFLVESVPWPELSPLLAGLPLRQQAKNGKTPLPAAQASLWPKTPAPAGRAPMQLASAPYTARGCVADFETLLGSTNSYTFLAGQTYYIPSTYWVGQATFQPGCVIKFTNYAALNLYGVPTFPDTLQTPVFTSVDDDGFGEVLGGISDGSPQKDANGAIRIYAVPTAVVIKNARVRWAKTGIDIYGTTGIYPVHTIRDCLLEWCDTGIHTYQNVYVTLINVQAHDVIQPLYCQGACSGSVTTPLFYSDKSNKGLGVLDGATSQPDTMGAAGPNHFVELLNGWMAVFTNTTGQRVEEIAPQQFFAVQDGGINYPTGQILDGRVVYDHESQRWVASAIDGGGGSQQVILAVSTNSSPLGLSTNWSKYVVPIARAGLLSDYATLGVDKNGIYIAAFHFHRENGQTVADGNSVMAIKKPQIFQGNFLSSGPFFTNLSGLNTAAIQPAVNFDDPPSGGHTWFVAKGPRQETPSYKPGQIFYRRLQWSNSVASWVDGSWRLLPATNYLDYYDLDAGNISAPQAGGAPSIDLAVGSRLMMAVIRNNFLWTCQMVGLDGTDGDYDGGSSGGSVDRSAVQWLKLQINATGEPLTYSLHGRIFDSRATDPYFYYFPSLMVNSAGDMVAGFSGSRSAEYIGAFYSGRLANGITSDRPVLIQAGRSHFGESRWGDYSYTSLDPTDGLSFWTLQEYAENVPDTPQNFGTWMAKVKH